MQSAPYARVEDPEIHNKRQQIIDNHDNNGGGLQRLIACAIGFFNGLFTLVFSVGLSVQAFTAFSGETHSGLLGVVDSPLTSVFMVAIIVGASVFSMKAASKSYARGYEISNESVSTNRLYHFYIDYMENYRTGKDIRLYSQHGMLKEVLDNAMHMRQNLGKRQSRNYLKGNIYGIISVQVVNILAYVYIGLKSFAGTFAVGSVVRYIGSISRFSDGLTNVVGGVGGMASNTEQLRLLKEYLALANEVDEAGGDNLPDENGLVIEFKNVSFKYPGSDNYALKNLSIVFKSGQRLAVVGMNGSGKTTFIKLMLRFYDPDEGEILLNGRNIKQYSLEEYTKLFSAVFQDFNLFAFPLGENVASGFCYDTVKAQKSLENAGFGERLKTMTLGTHLYKDFDEWGVDISGGEAQKIAMARALYKDAPFLILDEPTAALDPIAEYEVYTSFDKVSGDKGAIYISHRLSSCLFCDEIAVFSEGRVVQKAGHRELLSDEKGLYFELWNAQAQYYTVASETT